MMVEIEGSLSWRNVAAVATGATLALSEAAWQRIDHARALVDVILTRGDRAYGVNTGVGALSDTVVGVAEQRLLSFNIIRSHACGYGEALPKVVVRAIMAAQINNLGHGFSGIRPEVVDMLLTLLNRDLIPLVPSRGSVGYLTHMAYIGLVLLGEGRGQIGDKVTSGEAMLRAAGIAPIVLEAKEGLSLVNGTACSTGIACLALSRIERILNVADVVAALTFDSVGARLDAFRSDIMGLRGSPGAVLSAQRLLSFLERSRTVSKRSNIRTQDALSLRAIPHVHGAARDAMQVSSTIVDQELGAVTDNPVVCGTTENPSVFSEAHAVAARLSLTLDGLALAVAQVAAMSERRIDRLVNPMVSGLPAFVASNPGVQSGYMIAQYAAVALAGENRRLASPACLDGGVTSALQEDFLAHPTPSALKLLSIIDNTERMLGIELLSAVDALELSGAVESRDDPIIEIYRSVRAHVPLYQDDRPLGDHIEVGRQLIVRELTELNSLEPSEIRHDVNLSSAVSVPE